MYILLFGILAVGAPLRAQNALFVPFGQTNAQVRSYLAEKDYIRVVDEDLELNSLKAKLDVDKEVEYAFENGILYAVTMTRRYTNRTVGKEIMTSCLEYLRLISNGSMDQSSKGDITVYTALTTSRVFKLFVTDNSSTYTLALTAISRQNGPMTRDPNFYYEIELLEKKFNGGK